MSDLLRVTLLGDAVWPCAPAIDKKRAIVDGVCVPFCCGHRWKALNDEERNKYVEAAEKDKIRYETEMAVWNKPEAKQARAEKAEAEAATAAAEKLAKKEARKEERAEKDALHAAQKAAAAAAAEASQESAEQQ